MIKQIDQLNWQTNNFKQFTWFDELNGFELTIWITNWDLL